MLRTVVMQLHEKVSALDRLMEAKFVTMETLMRYQAEKVALALDASKEAINKADVADEKARDRLSDDLRNRFENVNEFRAQQKDIINTFMPRAEFDAFRETYAEQHILLRDQHSREIADLKGRLDRAEGKSTGSAGTWAAVVGAVTLMVIIVNVVIYALSGSGAS